MNKNKKYKKDYFADRPQDNTIYTFEVSCGKCNYVTYKNDTVKNMLKHKGHYICSTCRVKAQEKALLRKLKKLRKKFK